ncbi:MAG: class II glutamine amidotransferase [Blastocatellia bacterium]|nr:class II glutamine amidotransferase [Blastocatellia bacterium]
MCRFLCYLGPEILLSDLLYRPKNSLILQSYKSQERREPLNGDGFGVGWYAPTISPTPCVFTSLTPAWNNQNLLRLSEHVKSPCFFAHVRAASPDMRVSEMNCHPFQYGRYLWMHNGTIEGFSQIKRRLRSSLPDSLYNAIEGTTDSEHAFAVFLNLLGDTERQHSASEMGQVLVNTVKELERLTAETESSAPSYYNFAVSDGQSVAAMRYVSDPTVEPASLYYAAGRKYQCADGVCQLVDCEPREQSIVIASERLSEDSDHWIRVAPNHVLTVNQNLETRVELMEIERHGSRVETPSLYRRCRQSDEQLHTSQ